MSTTIYRTQNLEPSFTWQVGFNNFNTMDSGVNFRVTVRPLTFFEQYTRVPNPNVAFEETGVQIQTVDSLGSWQFTFNKNVSSSGGPYRDYQVVVEAHDSDGNTSAGNRIGSFGDSENGWTAYPNGYDIVAIQNPRPSGIELSNNLPTQLSATGSFITSTGSSYASQQYMGSNGEIIIKFTSGNFPSGIVGGFIYTSSTQFPTQDIFSPTSFYGSRVEQTRFDFDVNNPFIYSAHAAFNVRGAPYCFVSLSFFDELDQSLLNNGIDISTGLYLSNNTPFYNDGAVGSISVGGAATFFTVQTTGYPAISGSRWSGLIGSGSTEIARVTTQGILNNSQNITTIFYMSLGITGLWTGYAGGTPGGIGGNSIFNITGKTPGGYGTGTFVAVGFNNDGSLIFKPISSLTTGQTVISYIFPPLTGADLAYNSLIDNWKTTHYSLTGLLSPINVSGNFTSGIITNIGSSVINEYVKIDKGSDFSNLTTISIEQPIFMFTGKATNGPALLTGRFIDGKTFYTGMVFPTAFGGDVDAELLVININFAGIPQLGRRPLTLDTVLPPPSTAGTGRFYYLETKPYNNFFITTTGVYSSEGFLTHNSIYNY